MTAFPSRRSFTLRMFYTCAVPCNTRLLLPQHFRTPVAGKRRDAYRSISPVRVFPLFISNAQVLARFVQLAVR